MWSGERTHKTWPSAPEANRRNPKPIPDELLRGCCLSLDTVTSRLWPEGIDYPLSGVLVNLLSCSTAKLWAWTFSCLKEWRRNLWVFSWVQFNCWYRGFCHLCKEQQQNLGVLHFLHKKWWGGWGECKEGMGNKGRH